MDRQNFEKNFTEFIENEELSQEEKDFLTRLEKRYKEKLKERRLNTKKVPTKLK